MKKDINKIYCFTIFIFCFLMPISVYGSELREIETTGSISFMGVYKPIGTPDPAPPMTEIVKPDWKLPQTNEIETDYFVWIGASITMISYMLWKRKKAHE